MDTKTDRHREDEVKTEKATGGWKAGEMQLARSARRWQRPGRPQSGRGPANTSISDLFNCKRINVCGLQSASLCTNRKLTQVVMGLGGCSREMEGDIRHGGELEDETWV